MTSINSKLIFIVMLSALLNGCAEQQPKPNYAPVSPNHAPVTTNYPDITTKDETKYHQVKKGDTLYSISMFFSLYYGQLAQWNQIAPPYKIKIGQKIRLSAPKLENKLTDNLMNARGTTPRMGEVEQRLEQLPKAPTLDALGNAGAIADNSMDGGGRATHGVAVTETKQKIVEATATNRISSQKEVSILLNNTPNLTDRTSYKTAPLKNTTEKYGSSSQKKSIISIDNENMLKLNFQWPIKGKVLKSFSQADNKGIDIAGKMGQDVTAAEAGKVVYSGQSLIGYGDLLIIKHNDLYLSAYANNSQLLVAEGYTVKKGEIIAKVGQAGSNKTSLHFEIRKNGKPVNPLNFLPKK